MPIDQHLRHTRSRSAPAPPKETPKPATTKPATTKPGVVAAARTLRPADIFGGADITVWGAICKLCALMGAIPEVVIGAGGQKIVQIVSAGAYHAGDQAFDTFGRGGKIVRSLTYGERLEIDNESRALTADESLPDFVEVSAVQRETGAVLRARWPDYTDAQVRQGKFNGTLQAAHGVTSLDHARYLAQSAYAALRRGDLAFEVSTTLPWSDGGGPDDPDLLGMRPSAGLEVGFARFEESQADPVDLLVARGIPRRSADLLVQASRLTDTSLIFQVRTLTHAWDPSGYRCALSLRRFLR